MKLPKPIQKPGETSANYLDWHLVGFPPTNKTPLLNLVQLSMQFSLAFLDSWPNFLYLLKKLLRHVIIVADNGLIDVHLTLFNVVSRRLWIIRTSHLHKLTDECTHHCFYILIIVITLKTKPECKKLVINCILGNICPLLFLPLSPSLSMGELKTGQIQMAQIISLKTQLWPCWLSEFLDETKLFESGERRIQSKTW